MEYYLDLLQAHINRLHVNKDIKISLSLCFIPWQDTCCNEFLTSWCNEMSLKQWTSKVEH